MNDPRQVPLFGPLQASSPVEFRQANLDAGFRLHHADVRVTLLPDPQRARFEFACELETTGPVAASMWYYNIQAQHGEIAEARASDAQGGLEFRLDAADNGTSVLEVRLRNPVPRGGRYAFGYSYETAVRAISSSRALERTVAFTDWQIFNVACEMLSVAIVLPEGARLIRAIPAADEDADGTIRYRYPRLRALEAAQHLVGYSTRRLGTGFYLWVASAVGSALVGVLLSGVLSAFWK
ncbi:MAG TPA: hypothetical protein VF092_11330 [Longimicrobium sp.]